MMGDRDVAGIEAGKERENQPPEQLDIRRFIVASSGSNGYILDRLPQQNQRRLKKKEVRSSHPISQANRMCESLRATPCHCGNTALIVTRQLPGVEKKAASRSTGHRVRKSKQCLATVGLRLVPQCC